MKIGMDKILHIAVTCVLVAIGMTVGVGTGDLYLYGLGSVVAAVVISLAKEYWWDGVLGKGTASWGDLMADYVGIGLGVLYGGLLWLAWHGGV